MQLVTGTFKVLLHLRLKKNRSSSTQQPRLRQPCFIQGLQNADPDMARFKLQSSNIFADLVVDSLNKQILNQKKTFGTK